MHLIALCTPASELRRTKTRLAAPGIHCNTMNRSAAGKIMLAMKLTAIILLVACLQVSAKSWSQITISQKDVPLSTVFKEIQKQSGYDLIYPYELLLEK